MTIEIIGDVDKDRLYCTGSFTKLLTTYVCLSLLSEKYNLRKILDDDEFLDTLCINQKSREYLDIFQKIIGSKFTIHDLCTYYAGLPYTFDFTKEELESVEHGNAFKHHSITDEAIFLEMCRTNITPVYKNRCKFHYSEISIIFFGYFIEQAYDINIESLYQKYVLDKFNLASSSFSRIMPKNVFVQDLSDAYDYPSIAITNHGFFCYSNGFYTTLHDQKILVEGLINEPVFNVMTDIHYARAASNRLLNGLTVELRIVNDDIICGYEGLSYSGCNIWAYSSKLKKGYITTTNDEDNAYNIIYDKFGSTTFDVAPEESQKIYQHFIQHFHDKVEGRPIPQEYVGNYHRVKINDKELDTVFTVGKDHIAIRNPDMIQYNIIYTNGNYRIKCKDNIHGSKVGFYPANSGNRYMCFDGNLYKKA